MILTVPRFPLLGEPGEWDVLTLLVATVFLEAEGEPMEGKVGVAWVCRNRVDQWRRSWHEVILGPGGRAYDDGRPYEAFSAWNDDYQQQAQARLAAADGPALEQCWRAAVGALWRLIPDPTDGATHYLNVPLTLRIRKGKLPTWAAAADNPKIVDPAKLRAVLGQHTFLVA